MGADRSSDALARELLDLRRTIANLAGYETRVWDDEPAAKFYDRAVAEAASRFSAEASPAAELPASSPAVSASGATNPASRSEHRIVALVAVAITIAAVAAFSVRATGAFTPGSGESTGTVTQPLSESVSARAQLEDLERRLQSAAEEEVPGLTAKRDSLRALVDRADDPNRSHD